MSHHFGSRWCRLRREGRVLTLAGRLKEIVNIRARNMRRLPISKLAAILVTGLPVLAQAPKSEGTATVLGGERLGESWSDFLQHTQMPLADCATAEQKFKEDFSDTHLSADTRLSLLYDARICKQVEFLKQWKEAAFARSTAGRDYFYTFEGSRR